MIRHIIREERTGGYWLLRDAGAVINLGPAALNYLRAMLDPVPGGGRDRSGLEAAENVDGIEEVRALVRRHDFKGAVRRREVRWIASDIGPAALPADADAAPKRIYFELTRQCNLACRSCFNASRHPLPGELTRAEVIDVNRQAAEMGVFEMRYTGGECTTLSWFPEVVADARSRGMYVSAGTNGVYSERMREWLPHSGIDWFIISLDGDQAANDRVRGRGSHAEVIKTLALLARHSHLRIRLNMVVARHNLQDVAAVAGVAAEHGVESVNLIPLRPYGRSLQQMSGDMLDQQGFYDFIREVNRLRRSYPEIRFSTTIDLLDPEATTSHDLIVEKRRTCAAGVEACVVGPQGDVYGCSYSPASFPDSPDIEGRRIFVAGNLRHTPLRTIWRDSPRWAVFRDLKQYKYAKCSACFHYRVRCSGSCPIMAWYELGRTPGRSLAFGEVCDPYCFVDLMRDDGSPRVS